MAKNINTQTDPTPVQSGAPRWMRITLVVSLALNLLIAGAVVGAAITGGGKWRGGGAGERFAGPLIRAFSEQDQRVLKRQMAMAFVSKREAWSAHHAALQDLADVLRQTPYDAEALRVEMGKMRALLGQRFDAAQTVLSDHIEKMSASERTLLADRLQDELRRSRR